MVSPIIAAVHKESPFADTGVSFYDDAGNVFVLEVRTGGLFESTPLQAGMHVVSVNNNSTKGMTGGAVAKMVDGTEGTVTILAQEASSSTTTIGPEYDLATGAAPTAPPPSAMYASHGTVPVPPQVVQAQIVQESPPYVPQQQYPTVVLPHQQQPQQVIQQHQPLQQQQQPQVVTHQIIIQQPSQEEENKKTTKTTITHSGPRPPPGVQEGGIWRTKKYRGCVTWSWSGVSCFFFLVPFCLLCKLDEKTVYEVNGRYYTKKGKRFR